jgi:Zn-dependent protease
MVRFRLLGIPIGVHATFLFIALLGATAYRGWDIAWWTIAAFVSILLHELGHALSARAFGAKGIAVTLYGLGGVTTFNPGRAMTHAKSFIVSAAGSLVGIIAGGAVWYLAWAGVFDGASRPVVVLVNSFIFTALVWGALNWIPIVPLDGGHMVVHLVSIFNEDRAPLVGQILTWVSLAVIVPFAWINGYQFAVIILVMFAVAGLREYRDATRERAGAAHLDTASDDGVIRPDVIQPAPPAPPTPSGDPMRRPRRGQSSSSPQSPPDFPI